ncbi:unnamed protein product [Rhizoctonia solani]|uniref:MYND-type domain-containing protein n=1 Tax=Rhizoctonia solani TaxID=456999 RepID=A0A8H3HAP1_9AGAM|nr:unnamed protein product [Rhizoctonia solani]
MGIQIDVLAREHILEETIILGLPEDPGADVVSRALHQESVRAMACSDAQCGASRELLKDLLDNMIDSYDVIFEICSSVPGIHGWDTIFVAAWSAWKSSPRLEQESEYFIGWPLYDLTCRCALASSNNEAFSIEGLIAVSKWARSNAPNAGVTYKTVDLMGNINVPVFLDALTKSLVRPHASRLHSSATPILVKFITQCLSQSNLVFSSSSTVYFKAVFHRLWTEIDDERCLTDLEYRRETLEFAAALLEAITYPFYCPLLEESKAAKRSLVLPGLTFFAQVLPKGDWIDLAGRLLLLPTISLCGREVSETELETLMDAHEATRSVLTIFMTLLHGHKSKMADRFRPCFQDWLSVYRHITTGSYLTDDGQQLAMYHANNFKTWTRIGTLAGWFPTPSIGFCFNTGCPYTFTGPADSPVRICGGCISLTATYCDSSCQYSDYMRHRAECVSYKGHC